MRLFALMTSALAVIACGTATSGGASESGRTIRIDMSDFFFWPTTISLQSGERVTFVLKNFGTLEHEFMAGREAVLGAGYKQDWLAMAKPEQAGGRGMGHAGEGLRIAPNTTATVTVVVPAEGGDFEFGCFITGHYESGMKGKLVVAAAGGAPASAPGRATAAPHVAPSGSPMGEDDAEMH